MGPAGFWRNDRTRPQKTNKCSPCFYHLPTKLHEGNVFSHVCLSFCHSVHRGSHVTHGPAQGPLCPGPLPPCTWTPPDIFKLVHYETRMVGQRAIRILLECFLVTHWNCSVNRKLIVMVGEWWLPKISFLDQWPIVYRLLRCLLMHARTRCTNKWMNTSSFHFLLF